MHYVELHCSYTAATTIVNSYSCCYSIAVSCSWSEKCCDGEFNLINVTTTVAGRYKESQSQCRVNSHSSILHHLALQERREEGKM